MKIMAEEKENASENKVMENVDEQPTSTAEEKVDASSEKKEDAESEITTETQSKEEKLLAENNELREKHLRLYSEFENYRRRTAKERLELISTASEELVKDLLPVLDDFERSFKAADKDEKVDLKPDEGIKLIYNKLVKILGSKGLKPMEGLTGEPFDAEKQEAITQIPAPNEELKGKVVDVVEQGYLLGDKVIRHAKVVIGK
jgi:molecular chaperone GrpE